MKGLSNLIPGGDGWRRARPALDKPAPTVRQVRPEEAPLAISMIVPMSGDVDADNAAIVGFSRSAALRGVDLVATWVVESEGRLRWAVLPVVAPGRTMLFLVPTVADLDERDAAALLEAACAHHATRGVDLAQVLVEPSQRDLRRIVLAAGFSHMAELIYLYADVKPQVSPAILPEGLEWRTYARADRDLFKRAIEASYQGSLDCPGLNGLRDMDDVISGHMATGEFDPRLWFVLLESGEPRGVLLLAPTPAAGCVELVYVGLTPAARGRGLGRVMMRQALFTTRAAGHERLTLAVDSKNQPALRLYYRHGLKRLMSKIAFMRDLRKAGPE